MELHEILAGTGDGLSGDAQKAIRGDRADLGAIEMSNRQTGSSMTYMINGKQYIVGAMSRIRWYAVDRLRTAMSRESVHECAS